MRLRHKHGLVVLFLSVVSDLLVCDLHSVSIVFVFVCGVRLICPWSLYLTESRSHFFLWREFFISDTPLLSTMSVSYTSLSTGQDKRINRKF